MGYSIQEWTKQNFSKTAFKKFEGIYSLLKRTISLQGFFPQIFLDLFLNTLSHMFMGGPGYAIETGYSNARTSNLFPGAIEKEH